MSWDAVLLRIKGKLRPIEELDDADYLPLGKRKDVLAAIAAAFPAAEWDSPGQLIYSRGDLSIEFNPNGKSAVDSVIVEVRGDGDPITPLLDLAKSNGWAVLDASTSEFIDPDQPSDEGYGGYRQLLRGVRTKRPPRA